MEALATNAKEFDITLYPWGSAGQGIVHVIGPEMGYTQPGLTIVCGDSHTSTHGAFGALAFGIGTSEVEHVLATQTIPQTPARTMAITVDGDLPAGCGAKDVILGIINRIGTGGGVGHVIEYRGSAIRALSMEGRMTMRNMSIEAGARAMVAPDDTTFAYLEGKPHAPSGADWERALDDWRSLPSDAGATFDAEVTIDATALRPHVSWGRTRPSRSRSTTPFPSPTPSTTRRSAMPPAAPWRTWRWSRGRGSATSGRTPSSSAPARTHGSRTCAWPPGSRDAAWPRDSVRWSCLARSPKLQAEREGLDRVFVDAGFDWRGAGCSMCLGMNPDILQPGERSASTSNRNFEGRQGKGGRTHLVSPAVGRHRDRGPLHDTGGPLDGAGHVSRARPSRSIAPTWTPIEIVPAQFLKRIERTGFAPFLFHEWRKDPSFVLNDERYAGASILDRGANFGGSSREHAPWALEDFGFRAVTRRASPTSSGTTAARSDCSRSSCHRSRCGR